MSCLCETDGADEWPVVAYSHGLFDLRGGGGEGRVVGTNQANDILWYSCVLVVFFLSLFALRL